jgi:signal transduction histidine kinase
MDIGNNDWHWFELQLASAVRKGVGEKHYTCLLRDVNELVNIQTNYEKYKLEAALANKSRSEFLANMNHELRTPLNAIIGFAQMMENRVYGDVGHPKYKDYIDNIQSSGLTLLSKVNDLIDIANIDSGRMELNESTVDLVSLIRNAIELQSHRAYEEKVTLRENLPMKSLLVAVDRVRMLQALSNVISNAIKYNSAGGVVDIYCEKRKDGGINIIVEDDGSGISASQLERILSAFSQENSFFARSRHCAGIGLALSKEIVKLHQGKIEIQSEVGKGTLLKIVLPAERSIKKAAVKTELDYLAD